MKYILRITLSLCLIFISTFSIGACSKPDDKNAETNLGNKEIEHEEGKLWISEIKYQDPKTEIYLGSPSILRLKNGNILTTLDYFGPKGYRDTQKRSNRTSVYLSIDNGKTWKHISDIDGMYWGSLFEHNNAVYLIGNSAAMASISILKSTTGGFNWTKAEDAQSGLLFKEGDNGNAPRYHGAPTPVIKHNGRIYRAFENAEDLTLKGMRGYRSFVISINEKDDLLDASKWTKSNELAFSGTWDRPGSYETTGWLEGNIVVGTNGDLWNILRVNSTPFFDRGAMIKIEDNGKKVSFDAKKDFIKMPGGQSKFVIRKDEKTGVYWAMVNNNTDPTESSQRNILSLYASKNLRDWYPAKTLITDNQKLTPKESIRLTGFQYPDWIFDGLNMIYLSRTAYGEGVPRYHDSNRITFGRVVDFAAYLPEELEIK